MARATAIVTLVAGTLPFVAPAHELCTRLGHRTMRPNGDDRPMFKTMLALAATGILAAAPALAAPADPAPVIAAERAFSARAGEVGVAQSFLDNMTDDAIVFSPDPVKAKSVYGGRPPAKTPKDGGTLLVWWPNFAGIARSDDLGFTTGPAEVNGKRSVHFFTAWQTQADGRWKWDYAGGGEVEGGGGSQPARADDQHAGGLELLLTRPAHLAKHQMAGVTLNLVVVEEHGPHLGAPHRPRNRHRDAGRRLAAARRAHAQIVRAAGP